MFHFLLTQKKFSEIFQMNYPLDPLCHLRFLYLNPALPEIGELLPLMPKNSSLSPYMPFKFHSIISARSKVI